MSECSDVSFRLSPIQYTIPQVGQSHTSTISASLGMALIFAKRHWGGGLVQVKVTAWFHQTNVGSEVKYRSLCLHLWLQLCPQLVDTTAQVLLPPLEPDNDITGPGVGRPLSGRYPST